MFDSLGAHHMDDDARTTIIDLLDAARTMYLATVREDGYPQTTPMNFTNDGLTIFFGCDVVSQKATNLATNPKVSGTLNVTSTDWAKVRSLSFGGVARRVADLKEYDFAMTLLLAKYPELVEPIAAMDDFKEHVIYRVEPVAFSIIDYSERFGHHRLVPVASNDAGRVEREGRVGMGST